MFRVAKAPNVGDTPNPKMNFDSRTVFKIDFLFFKVRKMVRFFTRCHKNCIPSPLSNSTIPFFDLRVTRKGKVIIWVSELYTHEKKALV